MLSQDEARFAMVPTLHTTLGVKGFRPMVGTRDCKDAVYVFGALNLMDGSLVTRMMETPARIKQKTGKNKTRHLQAMFVRHVKDIARKYPKEKYDRVVLTIDNAPWHRGALLKETLLEHPHIELYRLPSYSPQLNVIERFWKILRRRATHNRLFDKMSEMRRSLSKSICYFQTLRHHMLSLVESKKNRSQHQAS